MSLEVGDCVKEDRIYGKFGTIIEIIDDEVVLVEWDNVQEEMDVCELKKVE